MISHDQFDIFVDFDIQDPLSEYFDCKGLNYHRLPESSENCLIDIIIYKAEKGKKILLFLNRQNFQKLIEEKSRYHDFYKLVTDGSIRVILKKRLLELELVQFLQELLIINDQRDLYQNKNLGLRQFWVDNLDRLKKINLTFLLEGRAGGDVRSFFQNWNFVQLENYHMKNFLPYTPLYHLKGKANKEKTFFSLCNTHQSYKYHRKWFLDEIGDRPLQDAIIKSHDLEGNHNVKMFEDLYDFYGKLWLDRLEEKHSIPMPGYYQKTCFEVICESTGQHDTDDTFYITEKTMKALLMKHPFVMVAPRHFLKNLRRLGFKTFDPLIDESYDLIPDTKDRIKAIVDLLESLDLKKSIKFYNDSRKICDHNHKILIELLGRAKFDLWANLENFFKDYI